MIYLIRTSYVSVLQDTKNYFLRSLIKEVCHYLPGDMGGEGLMKKVTNNDTGGGGLKFGVFVVMSFFNDP